LGGQASQPAPSSPTNFALKSAQSLEHIVLSQTTAQNCLYHKETNMRKLLPAFTLLASLLLSTTTLSAQQDISDWARLNSVTSETKLRVVLKSGHKVEGQLANVSDIALTLTVKNAPLELKREDVVSVYQITKKSAAKSTLIGLAVGTGLAP
jgi:hypothetical protein